MSASPLSSRNDAWTDPKNYAYTQSHSLRDWGWEFIRRNPAYKARWNEELKSFQDRKQTGLLWRQLTGYPDNPVLHHLKPEEITEKVYHEKCRHRGNFHDPKKFETFEIYHSDAAKWHLSAFQDPRSIKLVLSNSDYPARFIMEPHFKASEPLSYETKDMTISSVIDLNIPLSPQLEAIKRLAAEMLKEEGEELIERRITVDWRWIKYLRCLDAAAEGQRRKYAASVIFSSNPETTWTETLRQAREFVNFRHRTLMLETGSVPVGMTYLHGALA